MDFLRPSVRWRLDSNILGWTGMTNIRRKIVRHRCYGKMVTWAWPWEDLTRPINYRDLFCFSADVQILLFLWRLSRTHRLSCFGELSQWTRNPICLTQASRYQFPTSRSSDTKDVSLFYEWNEDGRYDSSFSWNIQYMNQSINAVPRRMAIARRVAMTSEFLVHKSPSCRWRWFTSFCCTGNLIAFCSLGRPLRVMWSLNKKMVSDGPLRLKPTPVFRKILVVRMVPILTS